MKKVIVFILLMLFFNISYGQRMQGRGGVVRVTHRVLHRPSVYHSRVDVRPRPIRRPVGGNIIVNGGYGYVSYPNEVLRERYYVPYGVYIDKVPSMPVYYEEVIQQVPQTVVKHNVTNNYIIAKNENSVEYEDDVYVQQTPTYTAWTINFAINSFSIITNNDANTNLMNIRDYAYRYPNSTITLYGYADAQTGNPVLNRNLSKNRCITIFNKLVNEYGIDQGRIRIVANGSDSQRYTVNNYNRCVIIEMIKY